MHPLFYLFTILFLYHLWQSIYRFMGEVKKLSTRNFFLNCIRW